MAGDMYIVLRIKPHHNFKLDGNTLTTEVKVPLPLLALGGSLKVPTLQGPLNIKLKPGTDPSKKLRLKGKGMPTEGSTQTGDLYVKLAPEVPKNLSSRQKELYEELAKL
jgi:DnaJ-class molecular chaperone